MNSPNIFNFANEVETTSTLIFQHSIFMDFNINDVSGGVVSKFAFVMLSCLLTSYSVSMAVHNQECCVLL